jgi:hypothetical protein
MWENIDKARPDSGQYSVMRLAKPDSGLDALREMFPEAKADSLNFVLFSTSGVHGTYNTIEEAEEFLNGKNNEGTANITFVIVHPRLVSMRYGTCDPENQQDIDYLKALRKSSWSVACGRLD